MTTVYMLWYEREEKIGENRYDDHEFFIGVYSTEEKAKQAIALLRNQSGFRDDPDCFNIYPNIVDETGWREGFVTIRPGEE